MDPTSLWWGPLCTRPTRLVELFIVLDHWNNNPWIDMSSHSDTLSQFQANQYLLFLFNAKCWNRDANSNFIVFGLTWSRLELTIYRTRGKHANYIPTADVVNEMEVQAELKVKQLRLKDFYSVHFRILCIFCKHVKRYPIFCSFIVV